MSEEFEFGLIKLVDTSKPTKCAPEGNGLLRMFRQQRLNGFALEALLGEGEDDGDE